MKTTTDRSDSLRPNVYAGARCGTCASTMRGFGTTEATVPATLDLASPEVRA